MGKLEKFRLLRNPDINGSGIRLWSNLLSASVLTSTLAAQIEEPYSSRATPQYSECVKISDSMSSMFQTLLLIDPSRELTFSSSAAITNL